MAEAISVCRECMWLQDSNHIKEGHYICWGQGCGQFLKELKTGNCEHFGSIWTESVFTVGKNNLFR